MLVYLNGSFIQHDDAVISVDDRGFLFADGIYEVVRIYDGAPFLMEPHLQRMRNGLRALRIPYDPMQEIPAIAERLLDENDLRSGDATLYLQVTRGAAPRKHAFPPADTPPTVYAIAKPYNQHPDTYWTEGVDAITVTDTRWSRCDVKSVSLLANVMANQDAHAAGAFEALFVRDGIVLEGSHSNLFAVRHGELVTYPVCNYILPGITRALVFEMAAELGIPAREGIVPENELFDVDELFLSGTTTEVMPIVRVDGKPIGDGRPGPVAGRLQEAYRARV